MATRVRPCRVDMLLHMQYRPDMRAPQMAYLTAIVTSTLADSRMPGACVYLL